MGATNPSTRPTPGPYVAHGARVWNAAGDILIAHCNSPQLCVAGNEANARTLAESDTAIDLVRRMVESAKASPTSTPAGQCFVDALQMLARIDGHPVFPAAG